MTLQRVDGGFGLVVSWRLPSYADLMAQRDPRHMGGNDKDVAHWPDPDIAYVMERSFARAGEHILDEDAEVRLVARAPDNVPLARARSLLCCAPVARVSRGLWTIRKKTGDFGQANGKRSFVYRFHLPLQDARDWSRQRPLTPIATVGLKGNAAAVDSADIASSTAWRAGMILMASRRAFAIIRSIHRLTLLISEGYDGPDEVVAAASALAAEAANAARSMRPRIAGVASRSLFQETIAWATNPATQPASVEEALAGAKLPLVIEDYWPDTATFPLAFGTGAAADSTFNPVSGGNHAAFGSCALTTCRQLSS